MQKKLWWFSIIEVMIGIFIFSLWLASIYALLITTMNLNEYSKNSIIATNLARESLEIVKNIRDSNYENLYKWNQAPRELGDSYFYNKLFQTGSYYTLENNLDPSWGVSALLKQILSFGEGTAELWSKMKSYQLCLTPENLYVYCNDSLPWLTPTFFYRYVTFGEVWEVSDALKVTSKVIWSSRWYHEIQLDTIITDFLRQ